MLSLVSHFNYFRHKTYVRSPQEILGDDLAELPIYKRLRLSSFHATTTLLNLRHLYSIYDLNYTHFYIYKMYVRMDIKYYSHCYIVKYTPVPPKRCAMPVLY